MEWCGTYAHPQDYTLLNKATFKISSLITMDPSRKTIVNNKVFKKYFGCSLSQLASCWEGLDITCKMVGHD